MKPDKPLPILRVLSSKTWITAGMKIVKNFLPGPKGLSFRKERFLTLRLDEPTLAELKEVEDNKGLGMSTIVLMWVRERLAGNSSIGKGWPEVLKLLAASSEDSERCFGSNKSQMNFNGLVDSI